MPPHYPHEAVVAGVSGTVYVLVRIDRQGHLNDAIPDGGVYSVDQSLHLMTPLDSV
ncbi:MAG: energy transducer TonB [Rhodanobacter sp.]